MKRLLFFFVLLLVVAAAGCAGQPFDHPDGRSPAQERADYKACRAKAENALASGVGESKFNVNELTAKCMRGKGYKERLQGF